MYIRKVTLVRSFCFLEVINLNLLNKEMYMRYNEDIKKALEKIFEELDEIRHKIEGLSNSVVNIDIDVSALRAEVEVISRKIKEKVQKEE